MPIRSFRPLAACEFACRVSAIALAAAAATALCVDSAAAESLREALAAAYKYNPSLDAERARLRAVDEEVPRAMSGYRPQIFGQADVGFQNNNVRPDSASEGKVYPKGYAFSLEQNVFNGLQTTNAVREAEAGVRAGRETLRDAERAVLLAAVTVYVDVVRDIAVVKLQENNVQVLTQELKATQDRYDLGEVTRTDLAQARARRAASVSDLDLARANLKTSRAIYERVIGNAPNNLVDPGVPERLLPDTIEAALSIAEAENALIVAALYREQASRHTVDRIRGELLPDVSLEASYSNRFDTSRFVDETETTQVTGRLTVPIYQGGEVSARVRQAKHVHVSRLQEIEQVRTEVREAVVSSWSRLQASRAQLESDSVQVEANRSALEGVREEEKVGQRTLLDVLNAEQEYLNSQVNLVTTKRNLVVSAYSLLSAMGRLEMTTIGATGTVYDPEVHYHEVRRKWWGLSITHGDGRREFLDLWDRNRDAPPMK